MKYEYIGRGHLYHKRIKIKTTCIDLYYFGFGKLLCWLEIVKLCFVYIITSAGNTISLFKLSLGKPLLLGIQTLPLVVQMNLCVEMQVRAIFLYSSSLKCNIIASLSIFVTTSVL